jgi:hypothetical protein
MDTPRAVCTERVKADPERHPQATLMLHEIDRWFRAFAGATSGLKGARS